MAAYVRRLAGAVREESTGGILALLGILFFVRSIGILLGGIIHQRPITRTEVAVDLADLLMSPLWTICTTKSRNVCRTHIILCR